MLNWVDQRTGAVTLLKDFLTEDVPGGASYWYAFGSATIFAMIIQIATGIFLTLFYSPSATTAWESTNYIYNSVPFGKLIISIHYWGASAMIAFMAMHLLQVLLWGAYKKPRELQWIVGVILFVVTLVLGLTGYLLPWDLNALLASKVAIQIAGSVPIVGGPTVLFLQDGANLGTLTINRFFGIHVWLTPAILIALVGAHLAIFRWNGSAGPPVDAAPKLKPGRFWPEQMYMDTVVSFGMFAVIVLLAFVAPPPLDAKADPNNVLFTPYPAWYFMSLFALLGIVGKAPPQLLEILDLLATVVIPGGLVTLLIVLPFVDRNPSRRISKRPWVLGLTALTMVAAVGLSLYGQFAVEYNQEANRPALEAAEAATATAEKAKLASTAGGAVAAHPPGEAVFTANCSGCHGAAGAGQTGVFPALAGNAYVTGDHKAMVHTLVYGLQGAIKVNGVAYNGVMPAWKGTLTNQQIADVITYTRNAWGNKGDEVKVGEVDAAVKAGK